MLLGVGARNEMLCIGKRTNYDAPVLVQASGRPLPGRLTPMRRRDFTATVRSRASRSMLDDRSAADRSRPDASLTARSDEPARHIRSVPFLLGYRPVFAW